MNTTAPTQVPRWVTHVLVPISNLVVAFVIAGIIIALIGEDPWQAMKLLVFGAFGATDFIGFTLYYTTNFMFTGLAVAVAFHCGLFNIGGEGQAYVGGLGVGLVALYFGGLPAPVVIVLAILASMLFGAAWAFIPGYLQAKRGSHVVITTIMFNFLAAAMITYLLVEVLIEPGQQAPRTAEFNSNAFLPYIHDIFRGLGIPFGQSSLNLSFVVAIIASVFVWVFIWHTRWGYEIRTVGANQAAAVYAGISPSRNIILAMLISGGLAGMVGVNEIIGVHHRIILDFTAGLRLRRDRRRPHGPQPSRRDLLCRVAVRHALSGRLGTQLRHSHHHPRHGRGHPGPRHLVLGRDGARLPPAHHQSLFAHRRPPRRRGTGGIGHGRILHHGRA